VLRPLLLEGAVDDRDEIILKLKAQLRESESARLVEQGRVNAVEAGVRELRESLNPLYRALRQVFGEIEAMGVAEVGRGSEANPRNSAAWEQWKQRLGGATARAIDALMVHGEMNQTQLRIILGCATRTVTNVVAALNQAKLIDKNGGKISLKHSSF
jgi:hypothetical protein